MNHRIQSRMIKAEAKADAEGHESLIVKLFDLSLIKCNRKHKFYACRSVVESCLIYPCPVCEPEYDYLTEHKIINTINTKWIRPKPVLLCTGCAVEIFKEVEIFKDNYIDKMKEMRKKGIQ